MSQYAFYPSDSSAANPSVGTNGAAAPSSSTEIGYINGSGNLQPVTSTNPLPVDVGSSIPLPTGAATAANQSTQITLETAGNASLSTIATNTGNTATSVASIDTKTPTVGQKAMAASSPVVIASDQSTVPVSAASLPLPSGAATAANQSSQITLATTANSSLSNIDSATAASAASLSSLNGKVVDDYGASSGAVRTAAQIGNSAGQANFNFGTVGAQTLRTAAQLGNAAGAADFGSGVVSAQTLRVTPATDTPTPAAKGRTQANAPARNDYSSVNVTTSAFTQLVASTTSATNLVEVFDSSGQTMAFATGAAASEVIQFYIFPGGNGPVSINIAAGTRISVKAISATASVGEIDVNFWT